MSELPTSPMPVTNIHEHLTSQLEQLATSLPASPVKLATPAVGITPEQLERLTASW